jgi:hypothetical protein
VFRLTRTTGKEKKEKLHSIGEATMNLRFSGAIVHCGLGNHILKSMKAEKHTAADFDNGLDDERIVCILVLAWINLYLLIVLAICSEVVPLPGFSGWRPSPQHTGTMYRHMYAPAARSGYRSRLEDLGCMKFELQRPAPPLKEYVKKSSCRLTSSSGT